MATLEELRSSLDGARDLKSVVTTMQAMAAVNLRQFRRVAESMAAYHRTIELGLQIVLRDADRELRVGRTGEDAALAAVVLGSDQGMVGPFNERLAELRRVQGVVILRVSPGSAAEKAGLQGATVSGDGGIVPGDTIVAVDGKAVDGVGKLLSRLDEYRVGDVVQVTVLRNGQPVEVAVTLQPGV